MIERFFSQVWLYTKVRYAGMDVAEFFAYRVGLSIATLLIYVLIARYTTGGEIDLTRWVIGNAFALCIFECVSTMGTYFNAERFNGRLRSIIAAPTSKITVIMYSSVPSVMVSFLTITMGFVVGGMIFSVPFGDLNIAMFAIAVTTAAFACIGLGLLLAAVALITDSMYLILNAISLLILIFSGANFPVSQLPKFAQVIANAFPLFRSVAAGNLAMGGGFTPEFARLIF
jgi:ABC-2 type transport system permease protein